MSGHVGSVQGKERTIVVVGVVGLARTLFDNEPLGITRAAWQPSVDIVLFIASAREPAFAVLKRLSSRITGERFSVAPLQRLQERIGFVRSRTLYRLL